MSSPAHMVSFQQDSYLTIPRTCIKVGQLFCQVISDNFREKPVLRDATCNDAFFPLRRRCVKMILITVGNDLMIVRSVCGRVEDIQKIQSLS